MPLQTSGPIKLSDIAREFGGTEPHSLTEYYAGGRYVRAGTLNGAGVPIPSSGPIKLTDFYGARGALTAGTLISTDVSNTVLETASKAGSYCDGTTLVRTSTSEVYKTVTTKTFADGSGGTYTETTTARTGGVVTETGRTPNSTSCGYVAPLARGTVIGSPVRGSPEITAQARTYTRCNGFTLETYTVTATTRTPVTTTYADGNYGSYTETSYETGGGSETLTNSTPNSGTCGYVVHPTRGTYLSETNSTSQIRAGGTTTSCSGTTQVVTTTTPTYRTTRTVYRADGSGGSYSETSTSDSGGTSSSVSNPNSVSCGYVTPPARGTYAGSRVQDTVTGGEVTTYCSGGNFVTQTAARYNNRWTVPYYHDGNRGYYDGTATHVVTKLSDVKYNVSSNDSRCQQPHSDGA